MPEIPFADFGLKWFEDIVGQVTDWFTASLTDGYESLTRSFFSTPTPDGGDLETVFAAPASDDAPWYGIYEGVVGGEVMIIALLVLFLAVQGRHFVRLFRFGSAYADRRTRRSAWTGAVAIIGWYWLAVMLLYLVEALTIGLIPDVGRVGAAVLELLPAALSNPILTMVLAGLGGLAMVLLKAIYFLRDLLLYVYLYAMPIGLAAAFANIPVISAVARRFCRGFVPLAILPLPAVLLFRGYGLLFAGDGVVAPEDALLQYLVVVSLPVLALYLTWTTFRFASPLVAGAVGRASQTAVLAGTVAGLGYTAGAGAATTAARWGTRAGLTQAAAGQLGGSNQANTASTEQDTTRDGGRPEYRRTENDPGYY
jgi:hypothetical protein